MVQPIDAMLCGQRQDFDKLGRREIIAHACGIFGIGAFHRTQIVRVEGVCLGRVGGVEADMRNAGDRGAHRRGRQRRTRQNCEKHG